MLMSIRSAPAAATRLGGRGHHVGVVAEQLHRHRVLVGVDPQQLAAGASRCGGARRSSRPSRTRPARPRSAWPAGARTSCRCRPAAPARRGWGSSPRPAPGVGQGRSVSRSDVSWCESGPPAPAPARNGSSWTWPRSSRPWFELMREQSRGSSCSMPTRIWARTTPTACRRPRSSCCDTLGGAQARGAFVFPMHEPDGYPPGQRHGDRRRRGADGLLTPFCRVDPNTGAARRRPSAALAAGAKRDQAAPPGRAVHARSPDVRELAALAHERALPMLIHAGRGIPALGHPRRAAGR